MVQIARITTWATMEHVTAPGLNREFDNIVQTWDNTDAGIISWTSLSVSGSSTFATAITITPTTNQIVLGTTRTVTLTAPTPASLSRTWTIPDITGNGTFAALEGTQIFSGSKTFSSAVTITPTTNQLILGTTRTVTINATQPAVSSRVYTVPDAGAAANFVMSESSQTLNGALTLASALTISPATNQLILGTTHTATLSATAPASSRTYTMADPGTDASFLMTEGAQTKNGAMTLSSALTINPVSNQLVLGATRTVTLTAPTPAVTSRTWTVPDVGGDATFAAKDVGQTFSGSQIFSSAITVTPVTNQLILGTTRTVTVTAPTPAVSSRTWTIPDVGGDATFAAVDVTQTFSGANTFSSAVTISPATNQLVLGVTRTVTLTAPTPGTSSRTHTIPDITGNGTFAFLEGTQTFSGAKTFSSGVAITATSSHLTLSTSSNTLVLQANAQATSSRTWSIPDISGSGTFAALEGTQTFSGSKTFSSAVLIPNGAVGTPAWAFSGDTDNGAYYIGTNNWAMAAAGAKVWEVSAGGYISHPKQCCFLVTFNGASNVTGDATTYKIPWNVAVYNVGSNFDVTTNFQFTAPVTGKYLLSVQARTEGLVASETVRFRIVTTARTYRNTEDMAATLGLSDLVSSITVLADMTASDTAYVEYQCSGGAGTKTTSVTADAAMNFFSGSLIN